MQIIAQKSGIRPCGLVLQDKNKNPSNRRPNIATHGTAGNNRDLQRLESFFGADSPYVARRHHRDSKWTNIDTSVPEQPDTQEQSTTTGTTTENIESPSPQFPAIESERLLEAPTAALERLTQLTSEQLTNLQTASQQAGEILNDLKGSAEAGAGIILSNLEDAQRQLAPEVQSQVEKIGTVLEKQVIEAQDVLMQAVKAIKQQAEALSQQASGSASNKGTAIAPTKQKAPPPPPKHQENQTEKSSTTLNTASELESVAVRFKAEMHQLTERIRSLSEGQFRSTQEVVITLEQELLQRTEQIRSFISEKRVEISRTIGQLTTKTPQQQHAVGVNRATTKTAPAASQQKSQAVSSSSTSSTPVQQLTKTAESMKEIWQDKVQNRINVPCVSLPSPIANFDANRIKSSVADNPQAVALGAGVLAITALGLFFRKKSVSSAQAEQNAVQRARSRRRLDRQRNRFKQALGTDDDGSAMVDSSVFAAVQRIQSSKAVQGADDATGTLDDDDDEEEDDDAGGALGNDPESWDPAMKKEWDAFVKSSKLKDAALWDPNEIDEGLPEIYVDLERD